MHSLKYAAFFVFWLLMFGAPTLLFYVDGREYELKGWIDSDYNFMVLLVVAISVLFLIMKYWG